MKIKDILISSILIVSIAAASNSRFSESTWIGSGEVLLEILLHDDENVNMFGDVYIRGVASGLIYDSSVVKWMGKYNLSYKKRAVKGELMQFPIPVDWEEITMVVYKYLQNNPETLKLPSIILIEDALYQVYGAVNNDGRDSPNH